MQYELIPERLEEQRKKLSITKTAAAQQMNLAQGTYVRYENGTRKPTYATINMMAHVLDTTAEYLTGQTDDAAPDSIIVYKENDPVTYEIISEIKEYDEHRKARLLKYIEKLSKA